MSTLFGHYRRWGLSISCTIQDIQVVPRSKYKPRIPGLHWTRNFWQLCFCPARCWTTSSDRPWFLDVGCERCHRWTMLHFELWSEALNRHLCGQSCLQLGWEHDLLPLPPPAFLLSPHLQPPYHAHSWHGARLQRHWEELFDPFFGGANKKMMKIGKQRNDKQCRLSDTKSFRRLGPDVKQTPSMRSSRWDVIEFITSLFIWNCHNVYCF